MVNRKWKSRMAVVAAMVLLVSTLWSSFNVFPASGQSIAEDNAYPMMNSANVLLNGSYEENEETLPLGWRPYIFSGSPKVQVDHEQVVSGQSSLKMSAESSSRATMYQDVRIPPEQRNQIYTFSQWIKTEDVSGVGIYNRMFLINESGTRIGSLIELKKLTGTKDWTFVQGSIYVPDDGQVIGVKIENFFDTGTGTAWFDDASLIPLTSDVDGDLVLNGGFEAIDSSGRLLHWGTWIPTGSPTVTADTYTYVSGARSLKIHAEQTGRAAVVQGIPLKPDQLGQTFKISMWVKTEAATGGAVTRLQFNNSAGKRVGNLIFLDTIRDTNDWTKVEEFIQIPEDTNIATVKIENFLETGTGTVWFDDIRFAAWYPLEAIHLSDDQVQLKVGDSVTLDVYYTPEHASERVLIWTSSNPEVAAVNEGQVMATGNGIAVITAASADGTVSASCIVFVGEVGGITASDYAVETDENVFVRGRIEAAQEHGRTLTYRKAVDSSNGLVHVESDGAWSYYPNDSFTGMDSFTVVIEDGAGSYAVSKVVITVRAVNHPPIAEEFIQPTDKNTPVSGELQAADSDGDLLTYSITSHPEHGQVTMEDDGHWTYTPNSDYVGADAFTFTVTDAHGGMDSAKVQLYTAPAAEEIIADIKQSQPDQQHPRLLATSEDFARIRTLVETDDLASRWFAAVKKEADEILPQPPAPYSKPDGLRLDGTASRRAATLAFVYQVTQDERYAERAWEELSYVSSDAYPDWSPQHYLDTATMTQGIALGYDWLYHYLSEEQREIVRTAIVNKGLKPAVPMYLDKTYWWVYNRDNWNFVCNAGMTLGALAIADEEEELAGLILREAFKSIQYGLPQYSPDGSAIEGPGYWEYGTMFLVYFLSALETTVGHDYGFSEREGLYETPQYPIYIAGPQGTFNYSDNASGLIPGRLLLWFAERFEQPEYTWYHAYAEQSNGTSGMYDLIWYRPETYGALAPEHLDQYFDRPKAVTMRSQWNDEHALFVGFKGGVNGAPHGDLDTGSFVFDALGVRWAEDLGKEDYNLPGYWEMGENGKRWDYYRKRAESHNTLVIQPSAGPDQSVSAISEIVDRAFDHPQGAYAITDMTPAYRKYAASVKRGVALIDHRRQLMVQDEVEMKVPSSMHWFMHTRADIQIDESGKTAILSQGDKRLWVQLLTPDEAQFSVTPAEPMDASPQPSGQTPNLGVRKLTIEMEKVLHSTIRVWMVPLMPGDPLPQQPPEISSLDQWGIHDAELAKIGEITVDGMPLEEFESNRYVYEIEIPQNAPHIPQVNATAEMAGLEVAISQADDIPGTARIEVSDPEGAMDTGVYYVTFKHPAQYGIPEDRPALPVSAVTASADDGNVPENTLDRNMSTRWSAFGEQWIQYDLGKVQDVSAVSMAWYSGNTRYSFFNIEVSEDGESWRRVYDGMSSGETLEHELYPFAVTQARYIRINGFGNNQSLWNSIAETGIYGPKYEIERAVISYDQEVIKRKDPVPLQVEAYLNSGEAIDLTEADIRYYTSDRKVVDIEDGVMITQKTGYAQVWAEITYRNRTVRSNVLNVEVVKKNGNGSPIE
ncbi:tandem-95 repeat protein [Marinicrinis lubricantis]